jgi:hypothetical protein
MSTQSANDDIYKDKIPTPKFEQPIIEVSFRPNLVEAKPLEQEVDFTFEDQSPNFVDSSESRHDSADTTESQLQRVMSEHEPRLISLLLDIHTESR